ncbi:MAG: hypothetical protein IJT96_04570 [Lachnospiraceae bacterium]|nr:hypothetical protein [Lachnospiraceae bacterium]
MDILFCDFTGVYGNEGILRYGDVLDLKSLSGTKMYIDEEAELKIREKINGLGGPAGYKLRFLDNGNYHYMTRILASYEQDFFDLITFDNHSDDKVPEFSGLKSCGSWRLDIREENPYLAGSALIRKREDFEKNYVPSDLPLYISIDKDILSEEVLNTNWDQGEMRDYELFDMLEMLFSSRDVTAIDVCGEDLPDAPIEANRLFNEKLIRVISGKMKRETEQVRR